MITEKIGDALGLTAAIFAIPAAIIIIGAPIALLVRLLIWMF